MPPTVPDDPRLPAAVNFIGRTGAASVQIRYCEEEQPVLWMTVATYRGGRHEVDAALDPVRSTLRLCERLADGGQCRHCKRPSGFDPDSLDSLPLDKLVCWYQFDPGTRKFVRGCA